MSILKLDKEVKRMTQRSLRHPPNPSRPAPLDPPEGVSASQVGQLAALVTNCVVELIVLWIAVDAFERQAYSEVAGLAVFNGILFFISLVVLRIGRDHHEL
jgi:hypothetical protein